ncbi:ROK family protein [Deminuibacter soli]|uniref:ROK family protein n=1 Tax=Deminuibacter soli TaxID=2291815 RepID=A0A3E1NNI6_9BACT|nr:ROK family protein [Deminuibacter soli]RFM29496.1 ROK family protein [Deminuibacter soli]
MDTIKQDEAILTIDIGGSHIKATILNAAGELKQDYRKVVTPSPATPETVLEAIHALVKDFPAYDKISVGFPGYVRNGIVFTAPNLSNPNWKNIDLGQRISNSLQKPVRLVNDADQLGLGVASGKGFELVVTLGTGFGTAVLMDGYLLPHLELAHHPISKGRDYDEYVGNKALEKDGDEKWNKRIGKIIEILKTVFNYDRLYICGGNADKISFKLDQNISIATNKDGIKGGARLWLLEERYHITTNLPVLAPAHS